MNGGSVESMGPIPIGQVETGRPGKAVADGGFDDAAHSSPHVVPTNVYRRSTSGAGIANLYTTDHAEEVGSIIIGTDTIDPDGGGPRTAPTGVALGAHLYSSATDVVPLPPDPHEVVALSLNHLATLPGIEVKAINVSTGLDFDANHSLSDGNPKLTQFVDWSAAAHDVLYVASGYEGNFNPVPKDNFNGITVAYSAQENGKYRRVAAANDSSVDAEGDRTSIGLLAPGDNVDVTALNATVVDNGTSFAAPHVTGTAALLHQYANEQILNGGWDPMSSRRHETMKAVLLNSAEKFNDNESVTVPGQGNPVEAGRLLGMTRTVLKEPQPGNPDPTWFDSAAWDDSLEGAGSAIPLDEEMGAGHLNARRARTQFAAGEFESDAGDVSTIGWDYGTTTGAEDVNKYRFAGELLGGSFISITLAWDRLVEFANDTAPFGQYNAGDTFAEYVDDGLNPPDDDVTNDLDILLLPKFALTDFQTIAWSRSPVGTLEHLFFQIPETGEYEFWIRQHDTDAGTNQNYAVAWWAVSSVPFMPPGDYNGDTIVDTEDYNVWKMSFGEGVTAGTSADGNGDGSVNAADYVVWRKSFDAAGSGGAPVPEPSMGWTLATLVVSICLTRRSSRP
jgi:hypothetical protein